LFNGVLEINSESCSIHFEWLIIFSYFLIGSDEFLKILPLIE
jgi:hypothetical protein